MNDNNRNAAGPEGEDGPGGREWKLITRLLGEAQAEQRRKRRWGILFKSLVLIYLFAVLYLVVVGQSSQPLSVAEPHVAVVDLDGEIAADKPANADLLIESLTNAFNAANSKAVMLRINSPGGSPVQADYVYKAIMRLRKSHPHKEIYAVISDMGASGAYYIASAANDIYADPASIVGSIGVIMSGFGFQKAAEKLGVQRRVYTAGDNKDMMDPFSPVRPQDRQHIQDMLDQVHQQFIDAVKRGRGARLKVAGHPALFSGLFWTGQKALQLGLIDGLKTPEEVAHDVVGVDKMVDYTASGSTVDRLLKRFGTSVGAGVRHALGMSADNAPTLR